MRLTLLNGMRKVGRAAKKDFELTTKTWEHDVDFEMVISLAGPGPEMMIATDNPIYRYVNDGTKPHPIFAGIYTGKSTKKALSFLSGYKAKTTPNVIGSGSGGPFGKKVAVAYVNHPGTEGRNFDAILTKKWSPKFKRAMEQIMIEIGKESGHGI